MTALSVRSGVCLFGAERSASAGTGAKSSAFFGSAGGPGAHPPAFRAPVETALPASGPGASPSDSRGSSPARLSRCQTEESLIEDAQRPSAFAAAPSAPVIPQQALLTQPSFAVERGGRALWLERHLTLKLSHSISLRRSTQRAQPGGGNDDSNTPEPPASDNSAAPAEDYTHASVLPYCPNWSIFQSLVWSLVEQTILASPAYAYASGNNASASPSPGPAAPDPQPPSPGQEEPPSPREEEPRSPRAQAPLASSASASVCQEPVAGHVLPGARSLPLPAGIGPTGLSAAPVKSFRRAALALIVGGRMAVKSAAGKAGNGNSGGLAHMIAHKVAEVAAACPHKQEVIRDHVRVVVTGASVLYAAVNLQGCTDALMHVDFAHNFAASAKTVLDFATTAPSVGSIAADLLQIGVTVGLGVAQRRPPM